MNSRYPASAGTGSAGMTVAMDSRYSHLFRSYPNTLYLVLGEYVLGWGS